MFKEFRWPENAEKLASVQNFLVDRPEITKTSIVDLSWKTNPFYTLNGITMFQNYTEF